MHTTTSTDGSITFPTFSWAERAEFIAFLLAHQGSSDIGCDFEAGPATADLTQIQRLDLGRYGRSYATQGHIASGERPGATAMFTCSTRASFGPIVRLVGVPFGCAAEYDAGYAVLAQGGARANDMRSAEVLIAMDSRAAALVAASVPSAEHE